MKKTSVAELLLTRFYVYNKSVVILNDRKYTFGEIIYLPDTLSIAEHDKIRNILENSNEALRKLHWWEFRSLDEFPEYVRLNHLIGNFPDVYKVLDCEQYAENPQGDFLESYKMDRNCHYWIKIQLDEENTLIRPASFFIPATKEDVSDVDKAEKELPIEFTVTIRNNTSEKQFVSIFGGLKKMDYPEGIEVFSDFLILSDFPTPIPNGGIYEFLLQKFFLHPAKISNTQIRYESNDPNSEFSKLLEKDSFDYNLVNALGLHTTHVTISHVKEDFKVINIFMPTCQGLEEEKRRDIYTLDRAYFLSLFTSLRFEVPAKFTAVITFKGDVYFRLLPEQMYDFAKKYDFSKLHQ